MSGSNEARLAALIAADPARMAILAGLRASGPPDAWIGAGFVRNAVWDMRHGIPPRLEFGDLDVVWYDPLAPDPVADAAWEGLLRQAMPDLPWSVKNQARMHRRHGHAPYGSVEAALRCWPETATALAIRLTAGGRIDILAPYGLNDLFDLVLRPSPGLTGEGVFAGRVRAKRWLDQWPELRLAMPAGA